MAQSKKRGQNAAPFKAVDAVEKRSRFSSERRADKGARHAGLTIRDYVIMNLIFDAFCVTQLIIVSLLLRDFAGLYFFFGFLMCAFLVVSVFDYFSEKMGMGASAGDSPAVTNE